MPSKRKKKKEHKEYYYDMKRLKGLRHGLYMLDKKKAGKKASGKVIDYGTHGCKLCAHACVISADDKVLTASEIEEGINGSRTLYCPFDVCPYEAEMTEYKCYEDYDRAERIKWKKKNWSIV